MYDRSTPNAIVAAGNNGEYPPLAVNMTGPSLFLKFVLYTLWSRPVTGTFADPVHDFVVKIAQFYRDYCSSHPDSDNTEALAATHGVYKTTDLGPSLSAHIFQQKPSWRNLKSHLSSKKISLAYATVDSSGILNPNELLKYLGISGERLNLPKAQHIYDIAYRYIHANSLVIPGQKLTPAILRKVATGLAAAPHHIYVNTNSILLFMIRDHEKAETLWANRDFQDFHQRNATPVQIGDDVSIAGVRSAYGMWKEEEQEDSGTFVTTENSRYGGFSTENSRYGGFPPSTPGRRGGFPPSTPGRRGGFPPSTPGRRGCLPPTTPGRRGGLVPTTPGHRSVGFHAGSPMRLNEAKQALLREYHAAEEAREKSVEDKIAAGDEELKKHGERVDKQLSIRNKVILDHAQNAKQRSADFLDVSLAVLEEQCGNEEVAAENYYHGQDHEGHYGDAFENEDIDATFPYQDEEIDAPPQPKTPGRPDDISFSADFIATSVSPLDTSSPASLNHRISGYAHTATGADTAPLANGASGDFSMKMPPSPTHAASGSKLAAKKMDPFTQGSTRKTTPRAAVGPIATAPASSRKPSRARKPSSKVVDNATFAKENKVKKN